MGVEQQPQRRQQQSPQSTTTSVPVCEGFVEKKKSDHRRIPIGPSWKRRYCMLSSDGLRLYNSKSEFLCGEAELRIIPMCHIKSARQVQRSGSNGGGSEDDSPKGNLSYFDVETERGEITSFRFRDKVAWPALIEIELIRYKNKQDMARYKRMYRNNYDVTPLVTECTCHHVQEKADHHHNNHRHFARHIYDPSPVKAKQGLKTVVLPNQRLGGLGIGITVIPIDDGRVVVNRLLQGGPAARHGEILPGDEIVSANGKLITSVGMLSDIVRNNSSIRLLVKTTHLSIRPTDDIAREKQFFASNNNNNGGPYHPGDIAARIAFEKGHIRPTREINISPLL